MQFFPFVFPFGVPPLRLTTLHNFLLLSEQGKTHPHLSFFLLVYSAASLGFGFWFLGFYLVFGIPRNAKSV